MCGQIQTFEYDSFDECYTSATFIVENSSEEIRWISCARKEGVKGDERQ